MLFLPFTTPRRPSHPFTQALILVIVASMASSIGAQPAAGIDETDALVKELVAESQKNKVERRLDPNDPLTQAEEHCTMLGEDVAELGNHYRLIAKAYAQQRRWDDAAHVVSQVIGWRSSLATAEVALEGVRAGNLELAHRQLALSAAGMSQCSPDQADQVHLIEAQVRSALKEDNKVSALQKGLSQERLLEFLTATRSLEGDAIPSSHEIKERMKAHRLSGRTTARWALMLAGHHHGAGRKAEARALLDLAGELTAPPANYGEQRGLLDVAKTAHEMGEVQVADKALRIFTSSLSIVNPDQEWKAGYLADAATLLGEWGRKEEAGKLMVQAEESAPKAFIYFAADAHLAVARGWLRLGEKSKAQQAILAAARVAGATDKARLRCGAAARILVFHAEEQIPVQADITTILVKAKSSE